MPKMIITLAVDAKGWTRDEFEQEAATIGTMTALEISGAETLGELDTPEDPEPEEVADAILRMVNSEEARTQVWAGSGQYVTLGEATLVSYDRVESVG
jgi:hypothetical protein